MIARWIHRSPPMTTASASEATASREVRDYYARSRAVYAWFAPYYDAITRPLRRLRRQVVETAGVPPGARIVDVATGNGAQALAFAKSAAEVVGIDLSEAMLAVARRKRPPTSASSSPT